METTLFALAAGLGRRYGGLDKPDPVGPSGETLLGYSVSGALGSGFNRVVFVFRRDFEREFRERIGSRYETRINLDYVFQGLDVLPSGYRLPEERTKPVGIGHAIRCTRDQVKSAFAAINANDFYGADAYRALTKFFADSVKFGGSTGSRWSAIVLATSYL